MISTEWWSVLGETLPSEALSLMRLAVLDMDWSEHFVNILNLEEAHIVLSITHHCII